MAQDCIFCGIVDDDIPSRRVYESDDVLAFLDANPLATGHTLIIPKSHYARLQDLPANTGASFGQALTTVPPAVETAVDAPATTVAVHNGEVAGQEVPHVHAHVVPRTEGDRAGPIHRLFDSRPDLSEEELDDITHSIAENC